MARKRDYISKSTRFAVLMRDGFKCRYCGATPPDVVLHLDHALALANGGTNEIDNLVTACLPCNIGKGVMVLETAASGAGTRLEARPRPRVEFFWLYDSAAPGKQKPLIEARCVEGPDWSVEDAERRWRWPEYYRLCDSRYPRHYSTHGWSGEGFSPYEAAMYSAELVHARWADMHRYVEFIDDLILMRSAGHLPDYIAPFVLRALHPEVMHSRCDVLAPDYEEIGDNLALQAAAAFGPFLAREHAPWQRKR